MFAEKPFFIVFHSRCYCCIFLLSVSFIYIWINFFPTHTSSLLSSSSSCILFFFSFQTVFLFCTHIYFSVRFSFFSYCVQFKVAAAEAKTKCSIWNKTGAKLLSYKSYRRFVLRTQRLVGQLMKLSIHDVLTANGGGFVCVCFFPLLFLMFESTTKQVRKCKTATDIWHYSYRTIAHYISLNKLISTCIKHISEILNWKSTFIVPYIQWKIVQV